VQALGAPFVEKIRQRLEGRPLVAATGAVRIVQSALGDDAGMIGAAAGALQKIQPREG
jgi:hypothetical protein